ncbi:MAG: SpoIIE family protein phosphatase, partial [Limnochordia bacterium]
PGRLASYCSRIQELKMTIIDCLEAIRLNEYWQKRIRENQDLVAGQLQGVSDIIASLAAEVDLELKYAYDIEEKLERELQKLRLSIGELMAKRLPGGHLEIAIRKNPCRGQEQCRQQILPLINRQLGQSYALHRRQCAGRGECRQCQLQFLPAPKYSLTKEVRQVVQQGKTISGDRFGRVDLGDGKVAIIISDGMGSGPAAAMESTATVSMLEKMLTAGFDERYAVKLVNSLLLVRSPQETFATIDLALFDLYAGQVEFIKVGAPPSFLCRGETIEIIPATTPPAGILRELDIHVVKMELRPHDLILMCTDGIFSAGIPEEKGLGRLLLSLANTDDLHQVGESILNQMGSPGDNPWSDDATVALLRIEPNYHGHSFAIAPYELAS